MVQELRVGPNDVPLPHVEQEGLGARVARERAAEQAALPFWMNLAWITAPAANDPLPALEELRHQHASAVSLWRAQTGFDRRPASVARETVRLLDRVGEVVAALRRLRPTMDAWLARQVRDERPVDDSVERRLAAKTGRDLGPLPRPHKVGGTVSEASVAAMRALIAQLDVTGDGSLEVQLEEARVQALGKLAEAAA